MGLGIRCLRQALEPGFHPAVWDDEQLGRAIWCLYA